MASRKEYGLVLFLSVWFMLIFYFGNTSSYVARYLDVPIIPFYIFASYALSSLYLRNKVIAFGILIYFILSMFVFMAPMLEFRHNYNGEKRFALYVKESTEENAVVIAMDDGPFIEYYARRKALGHPIGNMAQINNFTRTIAGYLKNRTPVYLIESGLTYDPQGVFQKSLLQNFNVAVIGKHLVEDFHRADLRFQTYYEKLFKLSLKELKQ